jgi:hypothetical protein
LAWLSDGASPERKDVSGRRGPSELLPPTSLVVCMCACAAAGLNLESESQFELVGDGDACMSCDNGGPAARKYGDLGGAVNGLARRRQAIFFTSLLSGRRCDWTKSGPFLAPTFRMNKTQ